MKRLLPILLVFLLGFISMNGLDTAIIGKWRSEKPVGETDKGEVWQFNFDKKHVKVTKAIYKWEEGSASWVGTTAEILADGEDDEWEVENSYLSLKIRERYIKNRDMILKYEIRGDTMDLWEAEIFRRKSSSDSYREGLVGDWRSESYDQNCENNTRVRQVSFTADGYFVEEGFKTSMTHKYSVEEGKWTQIFPDHDGEYPENPKTQVHPYEIIDNTLYIWKSERVMRLNRRSTKK